MSRETGQACIDELEADCDSLRNKTIMSDAYFDDWTMTKYWLETNVSYCLADCRDAIEATNVGIRYFLSRNLSYDYAYTIPYWMFHFGGGEVTWQAICEAWIKDDFEGRAVTIATIDRMRQILWNEPFNAVWAARPEEQEF